MRELQSVDIFPIIELSLCGRWWAKYGYINRSKKVLTKPAAIHGVADAPEDAMCELAIELFERGVLSPEK